VKNSARVRPATFFTDVQFTRVKMAKKKVDDKNSLNGNNTKNESDLSSNDDEPNFSDPEGFVDSITDEGISSEKS
jgi:hypothetical protein